VRAHYRRYDESTATALGEGAQLLIDRWHGDLRRLRLDEPGVGARRWTMTNIGVRLQDDDPWAGSLRHGHSLARAGKKLEALLSEI
jgi:hypothetical protein